MEFHLDENLSMMVILPEPKKSLKTLLQNSKLYEAKTYKELRQQPLCLTLPQFEIDYELDVASKLGIMKSIEKNSNFSEFHSSNGELRLGQMIHKVNINFSGKSQTISKADPRLFNAQTPKFTVDRPFVFIVMNRHTNLIVLTGVVTQPVYLRKNDIAPAMNPQQQQIMKSNRPTPQGSPLMDPRLLLARMAMAGANFPLNDPRLAAMAFPPMSLI